MHTGQARLTSRERIRYRTMRPRSTASVWLSKSGELMPGGGVAAVRQSPPLRAAGWKAESQGLRAGRSKRERGPAAPPHL